MGDHTFDSEVDLGRRITSILNTEQKELAK